MPLNTAQSSNIAAMRYFPDTEELVVLFKGGMTDGKAYVYPGVSPRVYSDLALSKSLGRAFHSMIKPKYQFNVVELDVVEEGEVP
jgi:hypothetical protein